MLGLFHATVACWDIVPGNMFMNKQHSVIAGNHYEGGLWAAVPKALTSLRHSVCGFQHITSKPAGQCAVITSYTTLVPTLT